MGMTEEELVKLWYDDIQQLSDASWFDKLFELPNGSTYEQFFAVLPEPLGSYAVDETRKKFNQSTTLQYVFDQGFLWSAAKHGKVWRKLHSLVNHRKDVTKVPTVEELLRE